MSMVIGRFKEAVSDVAETIRRAFSDPPCRHIPTGLPAPGTLATPPLEAPCPLFDHRFQGQSASADLRLSSVLREEPMSFQARLFREDAWATWAAGAKVCEMVVFRSSGCTRLAVPSLPRAGNVRRTELPPFRVTCRWTREPILSPGVRQSAAVLPPPRVRRNTELMLGLPIAIPGEDFQALSKALSMRYTFQLVKATGENIRNLEVLGVYPIPVKGVAALSHDARTGRVLVNLTSEALSAKRGRFILARRKDDRSYVSCFVEE